MIFSHDGFVAHVLRVDAIRKHLTPRQCLNVSLEDDANLAVMFLIA